MLYACVMIFQQPGDVEWGKMDEREHSFPIVPRTYEEHAAASSLIKRQGKGEIHEKDVQNSLKLDQMTNKHKLRFFSLDNTFIEAKIFLFYIKISLR